MNGGELSANSANESSLHDGRLLLPLSKSSRLPLVDVDAGVFLAVPVVYSRLPVMMLTVAILAERGLPEE